MNKNQEICGINVYMEEEMINNHKNEIKWLVNHINENLKDRPNFNGFDLCDVNANGIQIRMFNKQIRNYSFGDQFTIDYDWSNYKEAANKAIENFRNYDNDKYIVSYKNFLENGEKYGWD